MRTIALQVDQLFHPVAAEQMVTAASSLRETKMTQQAADLVKSVWAASVLVPYAGASQSAPAWAIIEILPAHPIITVPVATWEAAGLLDLIAGLEAR